MSVEISQDYVVESRLKNPLVIPNAIKVLRAVHLDWVSGTISAELAIYEDSDSRKSVPVMGTSIFTDPETGVETEVTVEVTPEINLPPYGLETINFPKEACVDLLAQLATLFADKAMRQPEFSNAVLVK